MNYKILGVYLVFFGNNRGGELCGNHYAVILSDLTREDNTLLVAPLTSKKSGKKYRGGFTLDCTKYQKNPKHDKAFVLIRKMREVDKSRIKAKIYDLDGDDVRELKQSFLKWFKFLT